MPATFTLSQAVTQLRTSWGGTSENDTYPFAPSPINYAILTSAPLDSSSENAGWQAMTTLMATRAAEAFELWDDLISVSLNRYSGNPPAGANVIQFGYSSATGGGTYEYPSLGYYAGLNAYGGEQWNITRAEIWLNSSWSTHSTGSAINQAGYAYYGGYGLITYEHEIGHALGLSHPGSYNAGTGTITYANSAEYLQDTRRYTIMSYFNAYEDGSGTDHWGSDGVFRYAQTPMVHDVAAIQAIYGADTATRTGNTTYGFNATAGLDVFDFTKNTNPIVTIYDASGGDTLDLSGFSRTQRVDLTPGAYSDVGGYMTNNLAIAYSATIENAIGGSGNDTLIGNTAANMLTGGGGDDVLAGLGGNDIIRGGTGADTAAYTGNRANYAVSRNADGSYGVADLRSGTPDGADTLTDIELVAFADGTLATSTLLNHKPVVVATNVSAKLGTMVAISTAFSVADADGDTISAYRFADGGATPGGNHVMIGAVEYPANQLVPVTAAQLAQTVIHLTGGAETFAVQAYDGTEWSDFAFFTATAIASAPPVVTAANVTAAKGQAFAATSLFTASDADGDTITGYQLADGNADPASGHFVKNGIVQAANTLIDVSAAEIAQTTFQTGSGTDTLAVRAFDGAAWSAFKVFTVAAPANAPPVVAAADATLVKGATVAASSLFAAGDADGDTITRYQIADGNADPASGHFVKNGIVQAANTLIEVSAAEMAQTSFQAGSGTDTLAVRAFDGAAWSDFAVFAVTAPANQSPVVAGADASLALDSVTPVASLMSAADPNGDTIAKYRFADGNADASSGHFLVDGVEQAANEVFEVLASELDRASFAAAATPAHDVIAFGAFDGQAWSDWHVVTVTSYT